jgi:hypothetical protein
MLWGLKGARHLLAVRATLFSRWFDAFGNAPPAATKARHTK